MSYNIADAILSECLLKEKRLVALRENIKANSVEIANLVSEQRVAYKRLLLEFTDFASLCARDVDGLLWRQCFYQQIFEYRKSIRKTVQVMEKIGRSNLVGYDKANAHLLHLNAAFKKFLIDSTEFYQQLLLQIEALYRTDSDKEFIVRCFSRCLIHLGDIARYKELYAESKQYDFSESERYYERACFTVPNHGNPHNQLAVLATYMEFEGLAVYHYCRSILVREPFVSALDNLSSLFEKNLEYFSKEQSAQQVQDKFKRSASTIDVKKFMKNFVRLQAIVFKWARSCQLYRWGKQGAAMPTPINVEEFIELLQGVMEEYDLLLTSSAFSEHLLMKLLVIAIFGVHFASSADINSSYDSTSVDEKKQADLGGDDKDEENNNNNSGTTENFNYFKHTIPDAIVNIAVKSHFHTVGESLALMVVFSFTTRTANRVRQLNLSEEKSKKLASKLIPLLSIFAEWLVYYPAYLMTPPILEHSKGVDDSVKWLYSSIEMLRSESRSRSSMRSVFSSLKSLFSSQQILVKATPKLSSQESKLREHIELRGFLPLADQCEVHCKDLSPFPHQIIFAADDVALVQRLKVLNVFFHDWIVPMAVSEAEEASRRRSLQLRSQQTEPEEESQLVSRSSSKRVLPLGTRTASILADRSERKRKEKRNERRRERRAQEQPQGSNKSSGTDLASRSQRDLPNVGTSVAVADDSMDEAFPSLPQKPSASSASPKPEVVPSYSKGGNWNGSGFAASSMYAPVAPSTNKNPFADDEDDEDEISDVSNDDFDEIEEEEVDFDIDVSDLLKIPDSDALLGTTTSGSFGSTAAGASGSAMYYPQTQVSVLNTMSTHSQLQQYVGVNEHLQMNPYTSMQPPRQVSSPLPAPPGFAGDISSDNIHADNDRFDASMAVTGSLPFNHSGNGFLAAPADATITSTNNDDDMDEIVVYKPAFSRISTDQLGQQVIGNATGTWNLNSSVGGPPPGFRPNAGNW